MPLRACVAKTQLVQQAPGGDVAGAALGQDRPAGKARPQEAEHAAHRLGAEAAPAGRTPDPVADLDRALPAQMRADDAGQRPVLPQPRPEEAVAPVPPARDQPLGVREREGIGQFS